MAVGRRSSLPSQERPSNRWRGSVYMYLEPSTGRVREFDFGQLPVSLMLQAEFGAVFDLVLGPLGTRTGIKSADGFMAVIRQFAKVLASQTPAPSTSLQFRKSHLTTFRIAHPYRFGELKFMLRRSGMQFTSEFMTVLLAPVGGRRPRKQSQISFSEGELRRVLATARADIRTARDRIRGSLRLIERFRRNEFDGDTHTLEQHRALLLSRFVDSGEVPRLQWAHRTSDRPALNRGGFASAGDLVSAVSLTSDEMFAFAILLAGLTGLNIGTLANAKVGHHRADASDGKDVGVLILDLVKPRRGKFQAEMTLPLTEVPTWALQNGDDGKSPLFTPFGTYKLLVELGMTSRSLLGSDHLFVWGGTSIVPKSDSKYFRVGLPSIRAPHAWGVAKSLQADSGEQLHLTFQGLRKTWVQLRDEPVAHTSRTMRDGYQINDRRELVNYQRVVSETLEEQVKAARGTTLLASLTEHDVERARSNPRPFARSMGVPFRVLERVLEGHLDTVLAACSDNKNGPHNAGPCQASFLLCAACPCAVSLPSHWPLQVQAHDQLLELKSQMPAPSWAQRFGAAWSRLADLIERMPQGAATLARSRVTESDAALITRLLAGDLD
jgi:hypothetical protein